MNLKELFSKRKTSEQTEEEKRWKRRMKILPGLDRNLLSRAYNLKAVDRLPIEGIPFPDSTKSDRLWRKTAEYFKIPGIIKRTVPPGPDE